MTLYLRCLSQRCSKTNLIEFVLMLWGIAVYSITTYDSNTIAKHFTFPLTHSLCHYHYNYITQNPRYKMHTSVALTSTRTSSRKY